MAAAITQGTSKFSAARLRNSCKPARGFSGLAISTFSKHHSSVLADREEPALRLASGSCAECCFPRGGGGRQTAGRGVASGRRGGVTFLARRALYEAIFGQHPYSIVGPTKDSIEKVTPEELKREFRRRFRPDGGALIIAGDFEPASVLSAVRSSFGTWRPPQTPTISPVPEPAMSVSKTSGLCCPAGFRSDHLVPGHPFADRKSSDYQAVELANAFYGGMFGSRLPCNIREAKGYTYSPGSRAGLWPRQDCW